MSTNAPRLPIRRLWAIAAAIMAGAACANIGVVTGGIRAAARPGPGPAAAAAPQGAVTSPVPATTAAATTTPPPTVSRTLPFNAKLASSDIPVRGGGVRRGGCSGSLIAPEWIVTAGHCFHDLDGTAVSGKPDYHMTVTVGKLKDSDPGGHQAQVVDVRQAPASDLALAKLDTAITDVVPLTLPDRAPQVGERLRFAGWGSHSATVSVPSERLKHGEFSVAKLLRYTVEALPVVPRTVENSPCPDDSGSPYFVSDDDRTGRLVAIENSGPPCPQPGTEILARVDVLADWIRAQTGGTAR
ncbi:S1 family peptidase [Amycolatopsis samaneae]|uniref:S1 family peptidase n=1 Tax=Amycolatopsis samaneae TaxID=664691 RepID=A0ABW5GU18_9PSEU